MQNDIAREEATLEPTPLLRRICTPPSIKVLFQLQEDLYHQKFTATIIKTHTFQYNKNMIHNLSNYTLIKEEFSVLTKSLSFVPTPPKFSNKK